MALAFDLILLCVQRLRRPGNGRHGVIAALLPIPLFASIGGALEFIFRPSPRT